MSYRPLRSTWPDTTLLGGMKYYSSAATSIAETFERIRREQDAQRRQQERREAEDRDHDPR